MKICHKEFLQTKTRDRTYLIQKLLIFIWICCCYQGDEARPNTLSYKRLVTLECHVILKGTVYRRVTSTSRCNCSIWCLDSFSCKTWNYKSIESIFIKTLRTTYRHYCDSSINPKHSLRSKNLKIRLRCNESQVITNSSICDTNRSGQSDCFIFCMDYLYPDVCSVIHSSSRRRVPLVLNRVTDRHLESDETFLKKKRTLFRSRRKRSQSYSTPYRIQIQSKINSTVAVLQPFTINLNIRDSTNNLVENVNGELNLNMEGSASTTDILNGNLNANIENGRATFSNIYFLKLGESYKLTISYLGSSPEMLPWTSEAITVSARQLTLKPSGRVSPISSRENDTLSPAAGVIIYDVLNNAPANRRYLSQYTWEGSIALLYDEIYPGQIMGSTFQLIEDGSNEILFNDIIISSWGYSYILRIKVKAQEISYWDLSCLIGPFDVDMLDTFELPLIESSEFRRIQIVFDGDYRRVQDDQQKFDIFFLNYFGRKYPKVRWQNITVSEGSVIVDAMITGLTEDLEKTSDTLYNDITSGKADIQYEEDKTWKASRVFVPSRKLLEDGGTETQTADEGGGLSVAWIVAIVINVILIAIFIAAIVYCWLRRKKQQEVSHSVSNLKNFDSHPDHALFANKAENHKKMQEKTAFMENAARKAAVFTVEDERRRIHSQEHVDDDRLKEDNEDDPPGYPTPSPEPIFPTPIPTPTPEPPEEDFWRPDSYPQDEPEEEVYIPEPEPEKPKEDRYYLYHVTDVDGSRELIGQLYLQSDFLLNDVRRAFDNDRNAYEAIRNREYRFLDENLDIVPNFQESSQQLEKVFPSQEIYIQYQLPPETPPRMPRVPAYVGPLGICSAVDCTRAAKVKCLDCRNVAYCSKSCMRDDIKEHRRACYKPAWRL